MIRGRKQPNVTQILTDFRESRQASQGEEEGRGGKRYWIINTQDTLQLQHLHFDNKPHEMPAKFSKQD